MQITSAKVSFQETRYSASTTTRTTPKAWVQHQGWHLTSITWAAVPQCFPRLKRFLPPWFAVRDQEVSSKAALTAQITKSCQALSAVSSSNYWLPMIRSWLVSRRSWSLRATSIRFQWWSTGIKSSRQRFYRLHHRRKRTSSRSGTTLRSFQKRSIEIDKISIVVQRKSLMSELHLPAII